jgi:hypothetical protein
MTYFVDAISARRGVEGIAIHLGQFEKLDDAVLAAQRAVSNFLASELKPGMTAKTLFACYQERGLCPFIFLDDDERTFNVRSFNHFQYALKRCAELCSETAGT